MVSTPETLLNDIRDYMLALGYEAIGLKVAGVDAPIEAGRVCEYCDLTNEHEHGN